MRVEPYEAQPALHDANSRNALAFFPIAGHALALGLSWLGGFPLGIDDQRRDLSSFSLQTR